MLSLVSSKLIGVGRVLRRRWVCNSRCASILEDCVGFINPQLFMLKIARVETFKCTEQDFHISCLKGLLVLAERELSQAKG
jgi:hypothetical protein